MDGVPKENPRKFSEMEILREEMEAFLEFYIPPDLKSRTTPITVLSVGCGFATEVPAIFKVLPSAKYTGIDIRLAEIKLLNMDYGSLPQKPEFKVADASDQNSLGDKEWDLIILRNPQVHPVNGKISHPWSAILDNCAQKVKDGGYILLTEPTEPELTASVAHLGSTGRLTPRVLDNSIRVPITSKFPMRENSAAVLQKVNNTTFSKAA